MSAKARYRWVWVFVSEEGRIWPSTTWFSRSTTTMSSGVRSSYATPLGLMATAPRSRSTWETLPKV